MSDEYQINAKITVDEEGFTQGVDHASGSLEKFGEQAGHFEGSATELNQSLELVEKAFEFVKETIGESIKMFEEAEQAQIRLDATLKATGGTAGQTASDLEDLAKSLAGKTIFDDDAMKNAEARMLTFKNVTGDTFKQAISLSTDLASAFGADLTTATNTLGRALDNPVSGLTALHRLGVTFTEDQKQQIKAMQDTGNVAGAQAIIMETLRGKIGGVAEAMGASASGAMKKFDQAIEDSQKLLGKLLVEGMAPIVQGLTALIRGFLDADTSTEGFVRKLQTTIDKGRESEVQARATIGTINEKNASEKLTLDQYNLLIAAYPQLKGKVDAYSTTLIEAKKAVDDVAEAERKHNKALLEGAEIRAYDDFKKQSDAARTLATSLGLTYAASSNINELKKQQYELDKQLDALRDKAVASQAPNAAKLIHMYEDERNAIEQTMVKLNDDLTLKESLNNLNKTGNVIIGETVKATTSNTKALSDNITTAEDASNVYTHFYQTTLKQFDRSLDVTSKAASVTSEEIANIYNTSNQTSLKQFVPDSVLVMQAIQALANTATAAFGAQVPSAFEAMGAAMEKGQNAWEALGKGIVHSLGAAVKGIGDQLAAMAAADLVKAAEQLALGNLVSAGQYAAGAAILGGGSAAAYVSAGAMNAFEVGTQYAEGGLALVGERGPEVVKLSQGDQVMTAGETKNIIGKGLGNGGNYHFVFNSPKALNPNDQLQAFKQTARNLRFQGVLV